MTTNDTAAYPRAIFLRREPDNVKVCPQWTLSHPLVSSQSRKLRGCGAKLLRITTWLVITFLHESRLLQT